MRIYLKLGLFLATQFASAQLTLRPLSQPAIEKHERNRMVQNALVDKNTLPFWDDFSITSDGLPDSIRVWGIDSTRQWDLANSRGVFVNSTLPINPPSYRVITFDGVDSNGQFYGDQQGLTDILVSDTIDLSAYNEADDIYLSFYWQAGGNVERPDEGDSLNIQFYNTSVDDWQTVWSIDGSEAPTDSLFYQEAIKLDQEFIHDATLFRFRSFGDQDGPFVAWHLDWSYLNANR